ncbi:M48 family metalloprotease [candidate division KSB1 bacterium]|nr:M48 family metalloprotease [candidate division KSB1 bacterium]
MSCNRLFLLKIIFLYFVFACLSFAGVPEGSTPEEIELGRQAQAEIERMVRLVDDPQTLAKLSKMCADIAAVTERPKVQYTPKIIGSAEMNAFIIPGGTIYVTTRFLQELQSDDELAGVLCHEIAHNTCQHAIKRMKKGSGLVTAVNLLSLAAIILGKGSEVSQFATLTASAITTAVINGYTIEDEKEADEVGLGYMLKTQYNPAGFMTFMERLASGSSKYIEEEIGYYRTHPFSKDRVRATLKRLESAGVPIHRRLVTKAPEPQVKRKLISGNWYSAVVYEKREIVVLADDHNKRAQQIADALDWILDYDIPEDSIRVESGRDRVKLYVKDGAEFWLTAMDAQINGLSLNDLAKQVKARIGETVRAEQLRIKLIYLLF